MKTSSMTTQSVVPGRSHMRCGSPETRRLLRFSRFDRISGNPRVKAFVGGVTAAASGAIAGACFVLARRAIIDVPTVLIALAALGALWRLKVPEPILIAAGAAAGLAIFAVRT